jgi:hypothetical protein
MKKKSGPKRLQLNRETLSLTPPPGDGGENQTPDARAVIIDVG